MKQRWRCEQPLTWKEHKTIQIQDHLFPDGLSSYPVHRQCRMLMSRSGAAIGNSMSFPSHHCYPLGVVNGNEYARHIAYFLVAHDAIQSLWHDHRLTWPDCGFIKIGNASATCVEMAVMHHLSTFWLALVNAVHEIPITDETLFSAEVATETHSRICRGLACRRWPTDPYEVSALVQEMAIRLQVSGNDADVCQTVRLSQCAAIVNRSKRTLERWKMEDPDFPTPDVIGQGGEPDEWNWFTIKPYLEKKRKRTLPEKFPTL